MKDSTIKKFISHLENQIEENISKSEYCKKYNLSSQYFYQTFIKAYDNCSEDIKEKIEGLYRKSNNIGKYNTNAKTDIHASKDIDLTRSKGEYIRNEDGKIEKYLFEIFIHEKPSLKGYLTRDEMGEIYRLYSNYGAKLTAREVSRFFPEFSLIDFKRILRVFNITKASAQFPPHIIEETDENTLKEMAYREKESNLLRTLESEQIKRNFDTVKKQQKEIIQIKRDDLKIERIVEKFFGHIPENKTITRSGSSDGDDALVIHLSDLHVGAKVNPNSLYDNEYNIDVLRKRLNNLVGEILVYKDYDNIIINLLGDLLDGMDNQTARRDHFIPQNMSNLEQIENFIQLMDEFFVNLINNGINYEKIKVYSVSCGNHDGSSAYAATKALFYKLQFKYHIQCCLFQQFFGNYEICNHKYTITHGKDDLFCKRGLPFNLDDKTKVMIYEWLREHNITGQNIHFVKGDLHNDNFTDCHGFDYRNVLSLFGSSDYSMLNFSRVKNGVSYDIIEGNNILRGSFINL